MALTIVPIATIVVIATAPIATMVILISIAAARLADMLRVRQTVHFIVWAKTILVPIQRDVLMTFIVILVVNFIHIIR